MNWEGRNSKGTNHGSRGEIQSYSVYSLPLPLPPSPPPSPPPFLLLLLLLLLDCQFLLAAVEFGV